MEKQILELQGQVTFLTKENDTLKKFVKEGDTKLSAAVEELSVFKEFISTEDFAEVEQIVAEASELKNIGTLEEIKESVALLESYVACGKVLEITESLELLAQYKDTATMEELTSTIETLATLPNLDSVKESIAVHVRLTALNMTIESIEESAKTAEEAERTAMVESLATKYSLTSEAVIATLDLHQWDLATSESFIQVLNPSSVKKESDEKKPVTDLLVGKSVTESVETKEPKDKKTLLSLWK